MKVLHAGFTLNSIPGVMNQMNSEQLAAQENCLDWHTKIFCADVDSPSIEIATQSLSVASHANEKIHQRVLNWLKVRREYYDWLEEQASHYDVILLRHSLSDPIQANFIKKIKRPVFSVHHALEVPELGSPNQPIINSIRVNLERFFGKKTLHSVSGIIGVTDEILCYERARIHDHKKPGYVYPNGIFYPEKRKKYSVDQRGLVPEILFVASFFANWHGLDLLLDDIAKSNSNFVLHLVGALSAKDRLRASRDPRIKIHGPLKRDDINKLSQLCWLGLSSFALNRKKMKQACTLKVREYLMNGLPVYAGYQDVFPHDFSFYKMGPPDIEKILDYARSIRNRTRWDVARQAEPFISKTELLPGLYSWLEQYANGRSSSFPPQASAARAIGVADLQK